VRVPECRPPGCRPNHRQALIPKPRLSKDDRGFTLCARKTMRSLFSCFAAGCRHALFPAFAAKYPPQKTDLSLCFSVLSNK